LFFSNYEARKIMWVQREALKQILEFIKDPNLEYPRFLVINGKFGTFKEELIEVFLQKLPDNYLLIFRTDLESERFIQNEWLNRILLRFIEHDVDVFKKFLNHFNGTLKQDILSRIKNLDEAEHQWFNELFYQFLSITGQEYHLIFIFENIQNIDHVKIETLKRFFGNLKNVAISIIFTQELNESFNHNFEGYQSIELNNLSVQQVETAILQRFKTTPINARLITNHCYAKTAGNPLKIRLLIEGVYKPLILKAGQGFINVKDLQNKKITANWESIFQFAFCRQLSSGQRLLGLLAHIEEIFTEKDIHLLFNHFILDETLIYDWLQSGLLREINLFGKKFYCIQNRQIRKWIRHRVSTEVLKDDLLLLLELEKNKKLEKIYNISHLLFELDMVDLSAESCLLEISYLKKQQRWMELADRMYFLLRMVNLVQIPIVNYEKIFEELGKLYLKLGAYENAFEIFRRLRNWISKPENISNSNRKEEIEKKWQSVTLDMVRALTAMDSFLEARYLIRELKVKKFCSPDTLGACYELLGDIEWNLLREEPAFNNYLKALDYYKCLDNFKSIYNVYQKLKKYFFNRFEQIQNSSLNIFQYIDQKIIDSDFYGSFLRDQIQFLIQHKEYDNALRICHKLRRFLRKKYLPSLFLQMTFYYTEIYGYLGKWQLAVSHLEKIIKSVYVIHNPRYQAHLLMQLGLVYKEQAQYGKALINLRKSMELCRTHDLHYELNENRLHIGHLFLLVHGLLHAHEYLIKSHDWAVKNHQENVILLSCLYLCYYETKNHRWQRARSWLKEAKKIVNVSYSVVDLLNYLYYLANWLIETERFDHAIWVAQYLSKKAGNIQRYVAAAQFLWARSLMLKEKFEEAVEKFQHSLEIAEKAQLPQIQYLVLCEMVKLFKLQQNKQKFNEYLTKASHFIRQLAENIEDEILKTQFLEAQYHEDILKWSKIK